MVTKTVKVNRNKFWYNFGLYGLELAIGNIEQKDKEVTVSSDLTSFSLKTWIRIGTNYNFYNYCILLHMNTFF